MRSVKKKLGLLGIAAFTLSLLAPTAAYAEESAPPENPEAVETEQFPYSESPSVEDSPFEVVFSDTGYQVYFHGETDNPGAGTRAFLPACEGTYYLRKVSNTLEWGTTNTCTPEIPAGYAPMRVTAKLQDTCNVWGVCSIWTTKDGPITSGWTYSRVANAVDSQVCNSSSNRQYRILVTLEYQSGGLKWENISSGSYFDIPCDIYV